MITVHGIEIDDEFKEAIIEAISMKDLNYTVRIHKTRHLDAERWCRENLGPRWEVIGNRSGTWCCFWAGHRSKIPGYDYHFANERDMIWFALKFSS